MALPNRQELVDRIKRQILQLKEELAAISRQRTELDQQQHLVEQKLLLAEQLMSPAEADQGRSSSSQSARSKPSRSDLRNERKQVIKAILEEQGEAPTSEIIEEVQQRLSHRDPTRAQVQDVLMVEEEFESIRKGVWRLTPEKCPDQRALDANLEKFL